MTTYTFNASSSLTPVDWNTPADWLPQITPNGPDADVVVPEITSGSRPAPYYFDPTISTAESIVLHSLSLTDDSVIVDGTLLIETTATLTNGTLVDNANLELESSLVMAGGYLNLGSVAGITLPGDLQITGAYSSVYGNLAVAGSVTVASGGGLRIDGNLEVADQISNTGAIYGSGLLSTPSFFNTGYIAAYFGSFEIQADGALITSGTLTGGTYEANDGTLSFDGTEAITTDASDLIVAPPSSPGTTNGQITANGRNIFSSLTTIAASGILSVGTSFTMNQPLLVNGTLGIAAGTFISPGVTIGPSGAFVAMGTIEATLTNNGSIGMGPLNNFENFSPVIAGPALIFDEPISGNGTITLEPGGGTSFYAETSFVQLQAACSNTIAFSGGSGEVEIKNPANFTGSFVGFSPGYINHIFRSLTYILLDGIGIADLTGSLYVGDASGGTLILQEGTQSLDLDFVGNYQLSDFGLYAGPRAFSTSPPSLYVEALGVPCFARGTQIAAAEGSKRVETLAAGDHVVTASCRLRRVRWVGHRKIDARIHPHAEQVWPVRICQHAFAENAPSRDLFLSPDHAVFMDGRLIPIRHLINGASIIQLAQDDVEYWHVELDSHDILLAENLPVESYLDTGNRTSFVNGSAPATGHSQQGQFTWDDACANLCTSGPAIPAMRRQLLARLPALGYRKVSDRPWHLDLGAKTIRAANVTGDLHRFILLPGVNHIRIESDVTVPAGIDPDNDDSRPLGVRIDGIMFDSRMVPLNDPALKQGFFPIEGNGTATWRWTNGSAVLALEPRGTSALLELLIRDIPPRWLRLEPAGEAGRNHARRRAISGTAGKIRDSHPWYETAELLTPRG